VVLKRVFISFFIFAVIIGLLGGGGYYGYQYYLSRKDAGATIRFTSGKRGDLKVILKETATLEPKKTIAIKSKVHGRIVRLNFEAGALIDEGSVIAQLDRDQYERTLDNKRRDLELAGFKLQGLMPFNQVVTEPEKIDPTKTDILIDRTLIEFGAAKVDYENKKEMFNRTLISLKSLDDARKQFERSFVAYHDAIRTASNTLITARQAYDQSVEDLAETTIRSPVSGVITALPVHEGEIVQGAAGMAQGTTLAAVADLEQMQAVVKLNEVDIGKIKLGDPVTLTLDSEEGKEFRGRVETIAPSGATKNNIVVFDVKIELLDKSRLFRPQMTANADVLVGQVTDVLKIPLEAIEEVDGVKKITLLTVKEGQSLDPTPTPATEAFAKNKRTHEDFYLTNFGPKDRFEEKTIEVKTGLANEIWAEVQEGPKDETLLKLPDISLPQDQEDFF
jgi:HlyD family secretion protein